MVISAGCGAAFHFPLQYRMPTQNVFSALQSLIKDNSTSIILTAKQQPAQVKLSILGSHFSQFPGNLAERNVSSSVERDLSLLLYSVASLSHLSQITYELSIVMRSLGITNIPSLVVSIASNFDSVSKPFVTSLHEY